MAQVQAPLQMRRSRGKSTRCMPRYPNCRPRASFPVNPSEPDFISRAFSLPVVADERIKVAENIEKEHSEKQRQHHTEIKALKNEIESHNSRLRMSEADLAKIADKLKKREIEVITRVVAIVIIRSCHIFCRLFACARLWKRCRCS